MNEGHKLKRRKGCYRAKILTAKQECLACRAPWHAGDMGINTYKFDLLHNYHIIYYKSQL